MTVLLTGGCGYIGSHAAIALMEAGHEPILADDFRNSSHSVPMRIGHITGKVPAFYDCDVCDRAALDNIFAENEIDCVIHFAGDRDLAYAAEAPMRCYRENVGSALSVLEAMARHSCPNFVYISSAAVYGPGAQVPFDELEPITDAASPYGRSVISVERLVEDAVRSCGLSALILRCFNPAGAHPSGLLGELTRRAPGNLMAQIARVASGELDYLRLFGDDFPTADGTGVRDFVHVMDVARACVNAVEYAQAHEGCMVVNVGSGRGTSVLELLSTFERVAGVSVPYAVAPKREGDAAECFAETVRSVGVLEWQPKLTLEDMCRDAWHWQRKVSEMMRYAELDVV